MARGWSRYDPVLRRPLSIHRVERRDRASPTHLAVMAAESGRGTALLARAQPGDVWEVLGPLGKGYAIDAKARNVLLIGGGLGLSPLVLLAEEAVSQGKSVTLVQGAATDGSLYPSHLLPPEVEAFAVTADGSAGRQGRVTDAARDYLSWADQVFACGPWGMYASLAQHSDLLQGKSCQVLAEVTAMGCGFGVCLGCSVETVRGYRLACTEGPRFELMDLFPADRVLTHPLL
jgi:dihydroorotate dehydrogenase electron transfer subunit